MNASGVSRAVSTRPPNKPQRTPPGAEMPSGDGHHEGIHTSGREQERVAAVRYHDIGDNDTPTRYQFRSSILQRERELLLIVYV